MENELIEYVPNDYLGEIINGKSIAYVCPAPNLVGLGVGEFIDSHDIVIRAGNLSFVNEKLQRDYGKRTDVLIHSFNQYEVGEAKRNLEFLQSLKYILCPMVSTTYIDQQTEFFDMLNARICRAENIDDRCVFKMFKEIGTIANVGFAGLVTLLKYDVKSIYVTGMTFYNMGNFGKVYTEDYYDMVTNREKLYDANEFGLTSAQQARSDIHDQGRQIEYFRKLIENDKRIILDEYLTEKFL